MASKKDLSPEDKKVLNTLKEADAPLANKQIAATTGLDSKKVSAVVKGLKGKGLVDSPARCKYGITDQGVKELG